VLGIPVNHTAPDPAKRAEINAYVSKVIEMAGKMGVSYVATMSGNMPGRPFQEQIDEIVRVYNEKYFALCEKHKVRLIWEPWPEGPNLATGPIATKRCSRLSATRRLSASSTTLRTWSGSSWIRCSACATGWVRFTTCI
jgi:sugar phosphate isomerase/epimerase